MNEWNKEYAEFLKADAPPSKEAHESLYTTIYERMHPSFAKVFGKLSLIQLIVGTATLTVCPQFHWKAISYFDIFRPILENYGHIACMLACGSFFFGTGVLTSIFVLSPEEILKIKASKYLLFPALIGLFLGAFICVGAHVYLEVALAWMVGAIVASLGTFELGRLVRFFRVQGSH